MRCAQFDASLHSSLLMAGPGCPSEWQTIEIYPTLGDEYWETRIRANWANWTTAMSHKRTL